MTKMSASCNYLGGSFCCAANCARLQAWYNATAFLLTEGIYKTRTYRDLSVNEKRLTCHITYRA